MSVSALTWAFAQEIRPGVYKFVLVALADYANEDLEAYPSIGALERKTCFDRKTIFDGLAYLKKEGFIEPTGERKGKTKQIHVYRLKESRIRNSSTSGTVPLIDDNSPISGTLQAVGNISLNRQEPSIPPNPQKGEALEAFEQFWAEILPANRKGKGRSREEFLKALKNGATIQDIFDGIASFRKAERKRSHQNDYRPLHPSTWLHQCRWEDDIVIEQQSNGQEDWIEKSIYG